MVTQRPIAFISENHDVLVESVNKEKSVMYT